MTPDQLLDKALIITELRRLAALPALEPRGAELTALHRDMGTMTRLDSWAEVDLVQTYVRPESVRTPPERTSGRRDRLLEAALGVLVFIPLLITWFGLREAVRAYGELADEDPKQATRPFLQLWQTGFGGHLSSLGRFENVALMAVLLIALLVGLSVWHARVRVRAERDDAEREEEREQVLAQLASVLTRAQMLLAPYRSATPQQFIAELRQAAKEMGDVAAKAEQSHKALSGATASVGHATDALKNAALSLTKEVPKLGAAADRIDTTLRDGAAATAKAGRANALAARGIADHVKAAGDTVEASLKALVAAQQTLVTKSESVAKATELASQALVSSTGRTGDAVDGMREATERWDAAAAHWQDAAARLDARMDTLATALPSLSPRGEAYGASHGRGNGAYGSSGAAYGSPSGAYGSQSGAFGPSGSPNGPSGGPNGSGGSYGSGGSNGSAGEPRAEAAASEPRAGRAGTANSGAAHGHAAEDGSPVPAPSPPADPPTTRLPPPAPRDGGPA
ncbi:hypothetical protein [Streptomyces alboniger]|uniref:Uncharacterized protein n=1 Tax=Streptomyces alboniger TaxID=132473 RepID=A0A5J6HRP3_STRAD|nr:hypothetical protein [Streptomyces alboniger]QEV20940.1 hypothetical protein CP975_28340 [Streptomyces alboniger]